MKEIINKMSNMFSPKYLLIIMFFFFIIKAIFCQEKAKSDTPILFRSEKSWGGLINTEGYGVNYWIGSHKTAAIKRIYEFEGVTMKSPKEVKSINPYFENAKSYKYGKLNSAALLRANVGRVKTLNNKPYWGGVEVRYMYFAGLTTAILKPVYLSILYPTTIPYKYQVIDEKYDPNKHNSDMIYGRASFFKGFNELKFYPGLNTKLGLSFEYGHKPELVRSLDVGVIGDVFLKKVPIMAFDNNNNYFITFFISAHFGKRKYY